MNHPEWTRSGALPPGPFVLPMDGDPLEAFLRWYGAHGPAFPMPPESKPFFAGGLAGCRLYRVSAFQVEMFMFPAGTVVPPHRHPNVDTIEMHVAGDFDFRVTAGGEMVSAIPLPFMAARKGPASRWWGRGIRVRPDNTHELRVGPAGAVFLSVQHWLKVPQDPAHMTVGLDWDGEPVNQQHRNVLSSAAKAAETPHNSGWRAANCEGP